MKNLKYTNIYALLDPRDGHPRYVGKSNNLKERLKNHCNPSHSKNTHKLNWIALLRTKGMKPLLKVIEIVPIEIWKDREKYWIRYFKKRKYKLVNHTEGGDGLTFGNQTTFKKGHIPWNTGTLAYELRICLVCQSEFKIPKCERKKYCSKECQDINYKTNYKHLYFQKGHIPWNKGLKNYTNKSEPVMQLTKTGIFIKEHSSCKSAAEFMKCSTGNIRSNCTNKSKSAKGFIWKYKKDYKNE